LEVEVNFTKSELDLIFVCVVGLEDSLALRLQRRRFRLPEYQEQYKKDLERVQALIEKLEGMGCSKGDL
jgi:hypothetical protein